MKLQSHLTVNDLLAVCKNAQSEGVNSLYIQYNGENLPVDNSISDLANACQNAHSKKVKSLFIQHNSEILSIVNAAIVPNRKNSDLVLFTGSPTDKQPLNEPKKSFLNRLFSKKALFIKNKVPLNKQLYTAFFNTLETVLISNGKNPNSFDFDTLQEIKSSLAQFNEALENYSNSNALGGAL